MYLLILLLLLLLLHPSSLPFALLYVIETPSFSNSVTYIIYLMWLFFHSNHLSLGPRFLQLPSNWSHCHPSVCPLAFYQRDIYLKVSVIMSSPALNLKIILNYFQGKGRSLQLLPFPCGPCLLSSFILVHVWHIPIVPSSHLHSFLLLQLPHSLALPSFWSYESLCLEQIVLSG